MTRLRMLRLLFTGSRFSVDSRVMLLASLGSVSVALCMFAVWCLSVRFADGSDDFYVQYLVREYKGLSDVYCTGSARAEWAEYFGEGCEGRKCRRSPNGHMTVLYFRCNRSARPSIRCRMEYESVFPHCCLPLCNDPSYFDDIY